MTSLEQIAELLDRTANDPDLFNAAVLGRKPYWWRQVEIGRSIVENYITVVCSGNATGKDYFMGGLIPWWLARHKNALAIVTGPSQTLLGTVTWKEIRRAVEGSRIPFGARLSNGIKASPHVVDMGNGWQALGYSTTSVERASGQHAEHLLVVVEEASGVDDEIWDALDSLKYSRLAAFGNPIRAEGRFVELMRQADKDKKEDISPSRRVNKIIIPSTDSPHSTWEKSPFGLADKTWLEDVARRYGKDSLWYRSHVLALVPEQSHDTLIPLAWLDRATSIGRLYPVGHVLAGARRISCDLGEGVGRDRTVIIVRDDIGILEVIHENALSLGDTAFHIARLAAKWNVDPSNITYDKAGIGKDLANHLARHHLTATGYFGSGSGKGDFTNMRTLAAWRLRRRLDPEESGDSSRPHERQPAFYIPPGTYWDSMREELSQLKYELVGRKTKLENKEDLAKRLGRSPDLADALIQSFAA
jgi:hypothetical protein